jgi:transposase
MKIIKYNEYLENDIRLKLKDKKYYINKILLDAEKGILPEESFDSKKEFLKFYRYLNFDDKRSVIFAETRAEKIAKKIKYEEENRKHIIDTIMNGLKNGISMMDTIKKEFPDINIDEILNFLTDEDKQLINKYHKKMSNSPKNIKNYNREIKSERNKDSVVDPTENFYDSLPYMQYSDKIRKLNKE